MKYKNETLKIKDNKNLIIYRWEVPKPIGVIQLIHGSLEHCGRYEELAQVFNSVGFSVIGSDHRGHGLTAKTNDELLGHIGHNKNVHTIIQDLLEVNSYIEKKHKNIPIILYGHSWGSYLVRTLIGRTLLKHQGAIVSGTGWENFLKTSFGLMFLSLTKLFKFNRDKKSSKILNKISFKAFNKKFVSKNSTGLEWCSGDQESQLKFFNDPLRGKVFSIAGFKALIGAAKMACSQKTINNTNHNLPILIVSGSLDPVGGMGRGVNKFANKLIKNNFLFVEKNLYDGQRHELHFDTNKINYFFDLKIWLKSHYMNKL